MKIGGPIIQNKIGDAWLAVCSVFNRMQITGFEMPWFILIATKIELTSLEGRRLVAHERCHQDQMRRLGIAMYYWQYLFQWRKYGYLEMPLEKEAYAVGRQVQ